MPPRITQKSCRPRVSHRIVVGTLANALLAQLREPNGVEHHRIMKPSSWNKQLGWSRCWNAQRAEGGQDQNPSWQQTGLDASYHICVSLEVRGEVFLLTSPFIGLLTETLLLAFAGGAVGMALGVFGARILVSFFS